MKKRRRPVIRVRAIRPIVRFIQKEVNSGIVLVFVTALAMLVANLPIRELYFHFFEETIISVDFQFLTLSKSLHHWINDGLMAIFFFLIGLEVKREILIGELSTPKKALFPMIAALGGMLVPALIFTGFNFNEADQINGWAIPMATDIAFALGIITLLKSKVPMELKIFLTTLAIIDDLGAVVTIAFFYTNDISMNFLLLALAGCLVLWGLNKVGVRVLWPYVLIGILVVWYPLLKSGVHATIAGVLVAFTIPLRRAVNAEYFVAKVRGSVDEFWANSEDESRYKLNASQYSTIGAIEEICDKVTSPLQHLEHNLHNFTLYLIMPLFAFANTGIFLKEFDFSSLTSSTLSMGIFFGLFMGKVIGITLFTFIFHRLKLIIIPPSISWMQLIGAGFLAGIGFTMSIFITELAFHDNGLGVVSKVSILLASIVSGIVGYVILKRVAHSNSQKQK